MVRTRVTAGGAKISQGSLALILCEAILHVLLERRILDKDKAIEAIDSAAEIVAEFASADIGNTRRMRESLTIEECSAILNSMRLTFQAHDERPDR